MRSEIGLGNTIERRAVETDDTVGNLERLFKIADENEGGAFLGKTPQRIDDIGTRACIDTLKRFIQQQ